METPVGGSAAEEERANVLAEVVVAAMEGPVAATLSTAISKGMELEPTKMRMPILMAAAKELLPSGAMRTMKSISKVKPAVGTVATIIVATGSGKGGNASHSSGSGSRGNGIGGNEDGVVVSNVDVSKRNSDCDPIKILRSKTLGSSFEMLVQCSVAACSAQRIRIYPSGIRP